MTPRGAPLSEREKGYVFCLLFPIFWPLLIALLLCDLAEAIGNGIRFVYWRIRDWIENKRRAKAMTGAAIAAAIELALGNLPRLIQAGRDVQPLIQNVINTFRGASVVTQADLDAMVAKSQDLEEEILATLPEGE